MLFVDDPAKTYTVEDFIEIGNSLDAHSYSKFSILSKSTDASALVYTEHNVLYDYEEEIKNICIEIEMTDTEYLKYRMKPKLLAYDVYGNTELYFMILFINGMYNVRDFDRKNIKLIRRKNMLELLERIYNAEQLYIKSNRSSIDYIP